MCDEQIESSHDDDSIPIEKGISTELFIEKAIEGCIQDNNIFSCCLEGHFFCL